MSRRRSKLYLLDGGHPFKSAVPDGYVDYPVRRRAGGRVLLFNFALAREMGLLPRDHPDALDRALCNEILDCFGLEIVNEYEQRRDPAAVERAGPRRYMATRYLQLQHPGRQGRTSGDGRSIWNGVMRGGAGAWDVSSCGTGATRLSPATALHGRFFRTGDPSVSYGCGKAETWDALCAALMSEILHHNGVRTERTLAIIDYGDGSCVGVRAYPNLMRPAHLFHWLKQNDHARLKAAVDYYIERETGDGRWPRRKDGHGRYRYLLERITEDFARTAARFESEYIFCWMDWDGDNILLDGAIIDYGSVRQFGLFHHEYRYDDVDRMSTTITEQRLKARYIVQTMAQLVDFLITSRRKSIKSFRKSPALARFDRLFAQWKERLLIERMGYDPDMLDVLTRDRAFMQRLRAFARIYAIFERAKSSRGPYKVSDGITWDAVFCMRDILRELPRRYLDGESRVPAEEFLELMRSSYASEDDVRPSRRRNTRIRRFQDDYIAMIERAAIIRDCSASAMLREVERRSSVLNRYERITGDGVLLAAKKWIASHNAMNHKELYTVFRDFVADQSLRPPPASGARRMAPRFRCSGGLHGSMLQAIREHREGL